MATLDLGKIKFVWKGAYAGGTTYEVDDVVSTNFEKYCQDLQCILINPPWSAKNPKFDFASFVILKFNLLE